MQIVAKGIHLRMVCDKPALIIPSQPVKGKHLDFMQDDSITEDNQWRMHERLELMPGDFKMVMTASPEDIELSIGKLKCSLHSLATETVSESILEKNNFDSLEKVSSTISTGGKTRHILEHSVIFSSFEEKGKVCSSLAVCVALCLCSCVTGSVQLSTSIICVALLVRTAVVHYL